MTALIDSLETRFNLYPVELLLTRATAP